MRNYLWIALACLIVSCSKSSSTNTNPPAPGKATPLTPAQNQICTSGTALSSSQSAILFTWTAADNAASYVLTIKNLLTQTSTSQTVSATQATVTLLRNTPFSWFITAQSPKGVVGVNSDTWKFYNSGAGVVTYAPFPADIVSPLFNQAISAPGGTINLQWTGSSVTSNIVSYDVYFGISNTPPVLKLHVTDSFINNIAVTSGNTYYWHVSTQDSNGNYTDSGMYQFTVK